jgi:FAD:protein FMN transferase
VKRRQAIFKTLCVPLVWSLSGCSAREMVVLTGATMGTYYRISLGVDNDRRKPMLSPQELGALRLRIDARLLSLERQMSTHHANSDLSIFARTPIHEPLRLGDDTRIVARAAQSVHAYSEGAFDPSVAALVEAWGFGRGPSRATPLSITDIANLRSAADMRRLVWRRDRLQKSQPIALDLNAIAKGYAVDSICQLLREHGCSDVLVDIGGEMRAAGRKSGAHRWRVGIQNPRASLAEPLFAFELRDQAIATSGDYRQFFEYAGRRYSHTIDPRSGAPVNHATASVTVIGANTMEADALATALMVMGREEGLAFAERERIAALFVERGAIQLQLTASQTFAASALL